MNNFDFNNKLYISQMIPTIQGEGRFIGTPSILIRLGGCNLKCDFCDTKYSWTIHNHEIFENFSDLKIHIMELRSVYNISHIMITGGEPLLYMNNPVFKDLVTYCYEESLVIEFETNGSLLNINNLPKYLIDIYDTGKVQFNISPKLTSSFYEDAQLYTSLSKTIYNFMKYAAIDNYNLKFVHDHDKEESITLFINTLTKVNKSDIYVMANTPNYKDFNTKSEFLKVFNDKCLKTVKYCMLNGYVYCPRIHTYLFNGNIENFY